MRLGADPADAVTSAADPTLTGCEHSLTKLYPDLLAAPPTLEPDTTLLGWTEAGTQAARYWERYVAVARFLTSVSGTSPDLWTQAWSEEQTAAFFDFVHQAIRRWDFGMAASYLPLLARLPDIYRGAVVVGPENDGGEWHVNRELNVNASSAGHKRYFAYRLIANRTLRGRRLRDHPLTMVGLDRGWRSPRSPVRDSRVG